MTLKVCSFFLKVLKRTRTDILITRHLEDGSIALTLCRDNLDFPTFTILHIIQRRQWHSGLLDWLLHYVQFQIHSIHYLIIMLIDLIDQ